MEIFDTPVMNRLILLGNGFDLAHKLKTSYNDFIIGYLISSFSEAFKLHSYEDELISIKRVYFEEFKLGLIKDIPAYINYYYEKGFEDLLNNRDLDIGSTRYHPYFGVRVKSDFFEHLATACSHANWVDIENEYYDQLKSILHQQDTKDKSAIIQELNRSLKAIILQLEKYLTTLPTPSCEQSYLGIFEEQILKDDIVTVKLETDIAPAITNILNFNYTSTVENYFQGTLAASTVEYEVNYIHGKLGDIKNPPIFGFGDELDSFYPEIELEKTKGFLEYIKSFWYFRTLNYHELIRFIEREPFQVYIWGHSCGLSDRTMLNMIFEHENCKSIKIYYYEHNGSNNFTSLTQEISRHFKNKAEMRKKIVPFSKSSPMPQL